MILKTRLRRILTDRFDEEELRTLCFDLGESYDALPGRGTAAKARELVDRLEKRERLDALIEIACRLRPDIAWVERPQVHFEPLPDSDVLPDPGPLPPGSRIPFARNALFTGREQDLKTLARALLHDPSGSTLITQAVQGMGGVGKTQLAVEFAYRYGRFFQGVHWINAAQPDAIGAEVAVCGQRMRLPGWPKKQPEQIQRTLAAWRQGGPRLVILDNLEEPEAARTWLRRLSGGPVRVVVTARRQHWPRDLGLRSTRLQVFSPEESIAFLRQYLPLQRMADEELRNVAQRLYHLPLALELAGRYLAEMVRTSSVAYLKQLDTVWSHRSLAGWREELGNPTDHDLRLAQTFVVSWERVDREPARRTFLVAGWCAPNAPIPWALLEEAAGLEGALCDETISSLAGLGLLELEEVEIGPAIHPLLAEYARHLSGAGEALAALTAALVRMTYDAGDTGLPARFEPLWPHVERVARAAERAGLQDASVLWNNLGYHLDVVADYTGAREAYQRALRIFERALGPAHPNVATLVNNLGGVLQDLGDLVAAREAFERALAIDEAVYGPDHPQVAIRVNNLGGVLQDLGDLAGAREAYERALVIDESVYGPDHPQVAIRVNNLGGVLQDLGDLGGAREAYQRALDIDEAVYGPEHPKAAIRVNNLGLVLQELGDLAGAREAYRRALAIFERVLGAEHPNVATLVNNLGLVLQESGDLEHARQAYERALTILEESQLPPDHPSIQAVQANLECLEPKQDT